MAQFCTNCGNKLDDGDSFCTNCGTKVDDDNKRESITGSVKTDYEAMKAERKLKKLIGGMRFKKSFKDILLENGLTINDGRDIQKILKSEIRRGTITSKNLEQRMYNLIKERSENKKNLLKAQNEFIEERKESENTNIIQEDLNSINNKIDELCGGFLNNKTFELKLLENGLNKITSNLNYRAVLKKEAENRKLTSIKEVEPRLDELLKMDVDTLRNKISIVHKMDTSLFRTQEDINKFLGPEYVRKWQKQNSKINAPQLKEERKREAENIKRENKLKEEQRIKKHEETLKELRETKTAKISIPYGKGIGNSSLAGAITGDIVGSSAGHLIGGALGAGDMLGALGGAATGGLLLGGAGALIGGLAKAADDGIRWADSVLVIRAEELIISGKVTIKLNDIKFIELGTYKNKDVLTLTLAQGSLQFATADGEAMKIVLNECIEKSKVLKEENQQKTIEQQTSTNNNSNADELMKYAELYEKGLLTEEEFNAMKKKLLGL